MGVSSKSFHRKPHFGGNNNNNNHFKKSHKHKHGKFGKKEKSKSFSVFSQNPGKIKKPWESNSSIQAHVSDNKKKSNIVSSLWSQITKSRKEKKEPTSKSSTTTTQVEETFESLVTSNDTAFFSRRISFHKSTMPSTGYTPAGSKASTSVSVTTTTTLSFMKTNDGLELPSDEKSLVKEGAVIDYLKWKRTSNIGPGLYNLGNTCFLNSVLQCLVYTPPLSQYLLSKETKFSEGGLDMLKLFSNHLKKSVEGSSKNPIAPKSIVTNIRALGRQFRIGRQEDAHEFLRCLIDSMQKSCLRASKIKENPRNRVCETTIVHRIFGGYLRSQVKCTECKYSSNTFDPMLDVSLELRKGIDNVHKALRHFTVTETLDEDNKWRCDGCKNRVRAKKQLTIRKPPNVLTLQLKRFAYGPYGGKIDKYIAYQENLDIGEFLSDAKPGTKCLYQLYGVLVHLGFSTNSGHYYSYVKNSTGSWYQMDDSSVSRVSLDTVLKQKAYILFYVRVPEAKIKASTPMVKELPVPFVLPEASKESSKESSKKSKAAATLDEVFKKIDNDEKATKKKNKKKTEPVPAPAAGAGAEEEEKGDKHENKSEKSAAKKNIKKQTLEQPQHDAVSSEQPTTPALGLLASFVQNYQKESSEKLKPKVFSFDRPAPAATTPAAAARAVEDTEEETGKDKSVDADDLGEKISRKALKFSAAQTPVLAKNQAKLEKKKQKQKLKALPEEKAKKLETDSEDDVDNEMKAVAAAAHRKLKAAAGNKKVQPLYFSQLNRFSRVRTASMDSLWSLRNSQSTADDDDSASSSNEGPALSHTNKNGNKSVLSSSLNGRSSAHFEDETSKEVSSSSSNADSDSEREQTAVARPSSGTKISNGGLASLMKNKKKSQSSTSSSSDSDSEGEPVARPSSNGKKRDVGELAALFAKKKQKAQSAEKIGRDKEGKVEFTGVRAKEAWDPKAFFGGHGLLGKSVRQWNDEEDENEVDERQKQLQKEHNRLLRDAVKEDWNLKRKAKLDDWDTALDLGKLKKVKNKDRENDMFAKDRENPFQKKHEIKIKEKQQKRQFKGATF